MKDTVKGKKSEGIAEDAENSIAPDLLLLSITGSTHWSKFLRDSCLYSPSHSATTGEQPILKTKNLLEHFLHTHNLSIKPR